MKPSAAFVPGVVPVVKPLANTGMNTLRPPKWMLLGPRMGMDVSDRLPGSAQLRPWQHDSPSIFPSQIDTRLKRGESRSQLKPGESLEVRPFDPNDAGDPFGDGVDEKEKKRKNEYTVNVGEAIDSLHSDLPHMFRIDEDSNEFRQLNWGIYTEDLVTDYTTIDPLALKLLRPRLKKWNAEDDKHAVVMASGLVENQQVLVELRNFNRKFVRRTMVTADTRMGNDLHTGAEIIESRWTVKFTMKQFAVPRWLAKILGMSEPMSPEGIVIVDGMSRFHLNSEGRIYRHAIDKLNLRGVDMAGNRNKLLDFWISAGPPQGVVPGGLAPGH
jgi:hypothetical protein